MIHPERRRENLKKIEEMDKRDTEPLQPDWKTLCMNKIVDMVEAVRCKDCKHAEEDCEIAFHFGEKDDWFCADGVAKDIYVPDKEGR